MDTEIATGNLCVAVIGMGNIGTRHLAVLQRMGITRTVAVSQHPERLRDLAASGVEIARDLQGWSEGRAALGIVCSNTGRHASDALSALAHGLDLLVEKPLASTAQEAARIHADAVQRGRRVFVGCVLRFSESLNTFRDLMPRIGRLHAVTIACRSYLPQWRTNRPYRETYSARADEGGVLRDLIHEIDYAGWLFGWPRAVQARLRNLQRLEIGAEEMAELNWETPAGCLVTVGLDYLTRPPRRTMIACGEAGVLAWNGIDGAVTMSPADGPAELVRSAQTLDEMFAAQARAFIDTSHGNLDPRLATGEDGVKALAVCDAARRASASRREELVEYP